MASQVLYEARKLSLYDLVISKLQKIEKWMWAFQPGYLLAAGEAPGEATKLKVELSTNSPDG